MGNHNLAGVPAMTANMFVRVELAKARIPAYAIEHRSEREVKANVVGFMHFRGGLMVSFNRAWYYWVVKLSRPIEFEDACRLNHQWREQIRVDGYGGGTEPKRSGVHCYHVDSQAALNALVRFLIELNGPSEAGLPMGDLASERVIAFQEFEAATMNNYPGMTLCSPPGSDQQIAELEISALLLRGGSSDLIVANHKEAIGIAVAFFGPDSERARKVREELATVLRSQIAHQAKYYVGPVDTSVTERYIRGGDLHDLMALRMKLLRQVGRHKEARSVQAALNRISPQIADDISRYLSRELQELQVCERDSVQVASRLDAILYHLAYGFWRLSAVQHSSGNRTEACLQRAKAKEFVARLSPESAARYNQYTKAA